MRQTVGAITPDNAPDNLGPAGSYTIVGNTFCRPNNAPVAALMATPSKGLAPLLVKLDASGSTDPDTGAPADTVASYTFTFGDGSPNVTQASPVINHTYQAGNYRAEVRVKDSRGKASANVAGVNIEVEAATKPAAPTNLTGTVSSTGQQGTIYWKDNAHNEVGFRIERCQGANCINFTQIGTRTTNVTSFLNTGLTPNTIYRFRVRAYNTVGNSAYSNVLTLDTTIKPAAPSNLTAASYYTGQAVTVYWTDNANNEVGFRIERCQGVNCTNFLEVGTRGANSTSFLNTGLTRNTLYRYRVRSYNKAGNSGYSNIASVTTK